MKKRCAVWMLLTLLVPLWRGTARAFSDVPDSHWASAEIRYVVDRGLFNGKSETSFAPSDGMTRSSTYIKTAQERIDNLGFLF